MRRIAEAHDGSSLLDEIISESPAECIAARLKTLGYDRFLIIERELGGDRQREDILRAKAMLEELFDL